VVFDVLMSVVASAIAVLAVISTSRSACVWTLRRMQAHDRAYLL
jgi:hypothetical protein